MVVVFSAACRGQFAFSSPAFGAFPAQPQLLGFGDAALDDFGNRIRRSQKVTNMLLEFCALRRALGQSVQLGAELLRPLQRIEASLESADKPGGTDAICAFSAQEESSQMDRGDPGSRRQDRDNDSGISP